MSTYFYQAPSKSTSRKLNTAGVWYGTVRRVEPTTGRVWVEVPRITPGYAFGPLNVINGTPPVGAGVVCAFVEGRSDDIVVLGRLSGGSGTGVLGDAQETMIRGWWIDGRIDEVTGQFYADNRTRTSSPSAPMVLYGEGWKMHAADFSCGISAEGTTEIWRVRSNGELVYDVTVPPGVSSVTASNLDLDLTTNARVTVEVLECDADPTLSTRGAYLQLTFLRYPGFVG